MKKLLMISAMLLVGALSVSAQTYYYSYLYTVDKNTGMKKKKEFMSGMYITFTNNKAHCYKSDKNGTLITPKTYNSTANTWLEQIAVYNFTRSQNGIHFYQQTEVSTSMGNFSLMPQTVGGTGLYTFSNDFSRMNEGSNYSGNVDVYERTTSPEEQKQTVPQLY